jgi:hypothetical protein
MGREPRAAEVFGGWSETRGGMVVEMSDSGDRGF